MESQNLHVRLAFSADDSAWIRRSQVKVPNFFEGHSVAPQSGDALRIGGRQFIVQARVWEHDGNTPVLRLFLSNSHAESDTVFG